MKKFLLLFGLLLVILLTVMIGRQIKRISDSKMEAEAPEALAKPIEPTEGTKAISRIRVASGTNIVICVLDAARADHFGCYGYPRPTTPNIDRLAKASLVFERHYCQAPETGSSTLALFQSRYIVPEKKPRPILAYLEAFPSLMESFQKLGFNTLFFSVNPKLLLEPALLKGFSNRSGKIFQEAEMEQKKLLFLQTKPGNVSEKDSFYRPENLLGEINRWLVLKPKQPFLTYIHFIQPHIPYDAPKNLRDSFAGKKPPLYWNAPSAMSPAGPENSPEHSALAGSVEETQNLYDANLRWGDWAVGELEQALRKAGLLNNTLLIIMADHGETLGEHGYNWHPDCPYDEALHIPLIMHFPGKDVPHGRIKALTQAIDLLPTLFDLHGKSYPAIAQGRSLLPLLAGETARVNAFSFAVTRKGARCETFIVRDLQSTLLLRYDGKTRALYDISTDPHQTKNIIASEPKRAARLVEAFRQFALAQPDPPLHFIDAKQSRPVETNPSEPQTRNMPEKLKKQLKTLGYLK